MSVVLELTDEELTEIKHSTQQKDDTLAVKAAMHEFLRLWRICRANDGPSNPSPNEALLPLAMQDVVDPSVYREQRQASMV